jgi:hypothetical protein
MVTEVQQTQCSIIKRFGGRWLRECGFLDGEKIVCMDGMYDSIMNGTCLIYSFGLADDWDFEESMANLGCTVRAYDPNVEKPAHITDPNLHYIDLGLSHYNGVMNNGAPDGSIRKMPVATLEEAIIRNGDEGKAITYLKMDVEGAELLALPEIVESGVLKNVKQIGIEMHTGTPNLHKSKAKKIYNGLLKSFKTMQEDYGYRLIAYNANGCMGKKFCPERKYHSYHDLVFYKP